MSWHPAKIASKNAVLASHPELTARFVKETALSKTEFFPDLDRRPHNNWRDGVLLY